MKITVSPCKVVKAVELYPMSFDNFITFKEKFPGGVYYMVLCESSALDPTLHCIPFFKCEPWKWSYYDFFTSDEIDFIFKDGALGTIETRAKGEMSESSSI